MNVLVVLAHPEPRSYNGHLAQVARSTLCEHGHSVELTDLYASEFDPAEAPRHYAARSNAACFDAQAEQRFSWENGRLPADVQREVDRIFWADVVIFQFPLWWFGLPAALKGWLDRVFVYGALYSGSRRHDSGPCRGKKALMCVTTGSSEAACSYNGREGDAQLILWPSLYALRYVGFTVLRPFLIHGVRAGVGAADSAVQQRFLADKEHEYRRLLLALDAAPAVPFNADTDWDESGRLAHDAPAYSPFIRHRRDLDLG